MRSSTLIRGSALGLIAAFSAACADAPTAPDAFTLPSLLVTSPAAVVRGQVIVCKVGASAEFEVDGSSIGTLNDGDCVTVANDPSAEPEGSVTVTEVASATTTLDSIANILHIGSPTSFPNPALGDTTVTTGTNSATGIYGLEWGTVLVFFNQPVTPPGGGEGCTPGYWKQPQHFDSYPAGYSPNDLFDTYFANAFPGMTLVQVAGQGGGGLKALGRHAVAALLNAASSGVDYDLSVAQVIAAFDAAYASGDYETQKNIFEGYNEQGCPLN
jgi:hypothetical protein